MSEHTIKLESVMQEVSRARGLPNEHYTNDEVFDHEKRSVLFANWSGVGFGKDIPNPGDALRFFRIPADTGA